MRGVIGVVTAWLAVAGLFGGESKAADIIPAKDDVVPGQADVVPVKEHFDRYLLSGGFDIWRNGGAAHGSLLWSPNGLAREGFTAKLLVAGGGYGYQSDATEFSGRYGLVSAMGGWRWKGDRFELTAFAGPDLQEHRLTPDDPHNRLRGANVGIRGGFDLWYQPSDAFMVTSSLSASSIGPNFWARAAIGWYLFNRAWIGPEITGLGGDRYSQLRLGVHATSFRTGSLEWTAGLGFARDSDERNGFYVRMGVLTRR